MNATCTQGNVRCYNTDGSENRQIVLSKELLDEVGPLNPEFAVQVWTEFRAAWAADECTSAFLYERNSALIEAKRAAQATSGDATITPVPDGRYALLDDAELDLVRFYRVASKNGKYFVWAYKSDEQVALRNLDSIKKVLAEIAAAGFDEAKVLFGMKSSRCYECGRRLTTAESRARGIGPDCAEK